MTLSSPNAWADGTTVVAGQDGFDAQLQQTGEDGRASDGAAGPPVEPVLATVIPTLTPACIRGEGINGDGFYGCGDQQACGEGNLGLLYNVTLTAPDGTISSGGQTCVEPGETPPEGVTIGPVQALAAFKQVTLPDSTLVVSPPGGETLVNLDTIFSTPADPFTKDVPLLGRVVQLRIRPASFTWRYGDGTSRTTATPGTAYAGGLPMSSYLTHRYARKGTLAAAVDTTWSATWRVDGGAWADVPGTVTRTGTPYPLRILTATPHLVG